MTDIKCPVCGKAGIPDYHVQDTVCPQCGSDLSIYKLTHDIEASSFRSEGNKKGKFIWIVPTLVACCLGVALVFSLHTSKKLGKDVRTYEEANTALQEQVTDLQKAQEQMASLSSEKEGKSYFEYTVRRGDSFWGISKKLYGTGTRYREIAESNGLTPESVLNVGDKLIIR